MHLPTEVLEARAAAAPTAAPYTVALDNPIHAKRPPIGDPVLDGRDAAPTESVLPLDHPIHKKRPPIVHPIPIKRDAEEPVLPLDHPIHKKKPPIVDPLPIKRGECLEARESERDGPWRRETTRDDPWKRDAARTEGGEAVDVAAQLQALPQCVQMCLARGPPGTCSVTDYACLCQNKDYLGAVTNCWTINCDASELQTGVMAATALCNATLDPSAPWPAEGNILGPPVIYSRAAWNIQAVMSSICSLILVVAITLGVLSCRAQARKDAQQQRSFTQATKSRPTLFSGQASGGSGRDHTSTFDFEESIITSLPRPFTAGARKVPRFTDLDDGKDGLDCWEMTDSPQHSPADAQGAQELAKRHSLSSASIASGSACKGPAVSAHSSGSGESADQKETTIVIGPGTGIAPSASMASVQTPATRTEFPDHEPFAQRGA